MSAIDALEEHAQPALACDLTAIDADQREAHTVLGRRLVGELAQETQELPDGYAFRFAAELYPQVVQFVANERLCCPFFRFAIEVTPGRGPIWLRITGPDEAVRMLGADVLPDMTRVGSHSSRL